MTMGPSPPQLTGLSSFSLEVLQPADPELSGDLESMTFAAVR